MEVFAYLVMALHILGAAEHVASAGNMCYGLVVLSAEAAERIYCLLIDFMANKVGCHGLVLGSTQGCLCFPSEAHSMQPQMGLVEVYSRYFFLLGEELTMHWFSKKGGVVGIIYCLRVCVFRARGKFHKEFLRRRCCIAHYLGECIRAIQDVLCQCGALAVMGGFHSCESSSPACAM